MYECQPSADYESTNDTNKMVSKILKCTEFSPCIRKESPSQAGYESTYDVPQYKYS